MEGSMTVLISFNDIKQSLSIDFFIYTLKTLRSQTILSPFSELNSGYYFSDSAL